MPRVPPMEKCTTLGAGSVTFGTARAAPLRNANARTVGLARQRIGAVIEILVELPVGPASLRHTTSFEPVRWRRILEAHHQLGQPAAAAELAVGHRLEAGALLHRDNLADAFILDRAQLRIVVRAQMLVGRLRTEEPLARRFQFLRPQQAADLIGTKRRRFRGHAITPDSDGAI